MKPHTVHRAFNDRPAPRQAKADRRVPTASWWTGATRAEWPLLIHARWLAEDHDGPAREATGDRE
jgi:hypothetical protein